jgi:hypothetical protein
VRIACRNGNHAVQCARNVRLTGGIASPRDDTAITSEGQTMSATRGDGHHVGKIGWGTALSQAIVSPADHFALSVSREATRWE